MSSFRGRIRRRTWTPPATGCLHAGRSKCSRTPCKHGRQARRTGLTTGTSRARRAGRSLPRCLARNRRRSLWCRQSRWVRGSSPRRSSPAARVLMPEDEFRSLLFPFLAARRAFGVQVRRVPFDQLAGAVDEGTDLVVTSHVRSQDGRVQDLALLSTATQRVGARLLVDATHSAGILQPPGTASGVDYLVAAAYKHLLCPRGVAFLRAGRSGCDELHPFTSSWRSARSPYLTYFGGELSDLADGAARFDVSLAWHPWLGARESLSLLAGVATEKRERWSVGLAISPRTGSLPTANRIVIPFRSRGREPSHAGSEAQGSEREGGHPARGNPSLVPRLQHPGRRPSGCKRP